MEVKFENCCTLTKEALLAMNRKNRNPVFTAAVVVLCAAYLVNGIRAAMAGYPTGLIAPLVCAVVLGVFAVFLPNMQAWFEYRKNLAAFGRDARCITKFYDDRFVVENLTTGKEASIPYVRIRKVAEDDRYIFLLLDTRIISPVDKSDFLNGTAEEFAEFIKARAVNTVRRRSDKPEGTLQDR
ncbi:MAG: YcxB family protein [Oscillospiraceae bacterium]|nr:YcxB family protein [Oscillospiraceae bacterium]